MRIMVMDGQGGGVGRSLLEALKEHFPEAELIAVGTNATATANMMKSGVTSGATGENAVVYNSKRADVIMGPMGIVMADAMLGEITPTMATAVASGDAKLVLIPMNKCHATIVGVESRRLGEYIAEAVDEIAKILMIWQRNYGNFLKRYASLPLTEDARPGRRHWLQDW